MLAADKGYLNIPCPGRSPAGSWRFLGQKPEGEDGGLSRDKGDQNQGRKLLRTQQTLGQDDEGEEGPELKGGQFVGKERSQGVGASTNAGCSRHSASCEKR